MINFVYFYIISAFFNCIGLRVHRRCTLVHIYILFTISTLKCMQFSRASRTENNNKPEACYIKMPVGLWANLNVATITSICLCIDTVDTWTNFASLILFSFVVLKNVMKITTEKKSPFPWRQTLQTYVYRPGKIMIPTLLTIMHICSIKVIRHKIRKTTYAGEAADEPLYVD